jgi:hypothetical protein
MRLEALLQLEKVVTATKGAAGATLSWVGVARLGCLVCLACLPGCIFGPRPVLAREVTDGTYCASRYVLDTPPPRSAAEQEIAFTPAAERRFAPQALDVARAIGALAAVEHLATARDEKAPEADIAELREQVEDAISVGTLDVASTVAAIECEIGRATEISANLREAETDQTQRLTAYSLVISAAGAIAAGVLDIVDQNATASAAVGIGGGLAGGALGFATLGVRRTATFRHERNILAEVWYGKDHPDFPEAVWLYVTRPEFTPSGKGSFRETLRTKWMGSGRLGQARAQPSADIVALYFGPGGEYGPDGLDDRVAMLTEVRDVVNLMNHDLQGLATEASTP